MKKTITQTLSCLVMLMTAANVYSQSDTLNNFEQLSLKDLLNVKIVSVSKNSEFLFDAALSASVVTKEEIQRTGCTSIMEAMRLVPGIIVREQTNGNYDIHLRGLDNIPPSTAFDIASTTTLVMIDSRPIYSYLRGGTFWETLPIDINDVEKIEVVRGPAAALYGPNAVNGVINIITRHPQKKGLYVIANNQVGSNQTVINNLSLGYKGRKWDMIVSGNYQLRNRSEFSYFDISRNQSYISPEYMIIFPGDTIHNIDQRYPQPGLAMNKYAGNAFFSYRPANNIKLDISTGAQYSLVQKVGTENEMTPLSTASSNSRYMDLRAQIKQFYAQFSYNHGKQAVDYNPGNKFDFHTVDANLEYNYTRNKLSIKPGISFRESVYDDTKYSDTSAKAGFLNTRGSIKTSSVSLRGEYKMLENKLRLIAGVGASKFNYPDKIYFSSQAAVTYKLNKNNLFRAVYSMAPRSSNIYDTYFNQILVFFPSGFQESTRISIVGNKDLKLLTSRMFEIGYRGIITSNLSIDAEVFTIKAKNTNAPVQARSDTTADGNETIIDMPIISMNLPLVVHQQGITVSLVYNLKKIQLKPFVTLQSTRLRDYAPYYNTPDAGVGPLNMYSGLGTDQKHKSTPAVFGGVSLNYIPMEKLNINLNAYYFSANDFYHLTNFLYQDGIRGIDHISGKFILNATIAYRPSGNIRIFCSGRNILNDKSREFFHVDKVPCRLFGGINYEF
jgi:iron complex outermembrane recepter protein